jgi:hypothetical protein
VPATSAPEVSADAGLARVLVSSDVPARVEEVKHIQVAYRHGTSRELLCEETPCAFTLPYGDHEILLTAMGDPERSGSTVVHAREGTVVVNHTLGRRHVPNGQGAGVALIVLGAATAVVAAGFAESMSRKADTSAGDKQAVVGTFVAGLGAIGLGCLFLAASPTMEQPGSTTQWSPASAPPPAKRVGIGASLGFKF